MTSFVSDEHAQVESAVAGQLPQGLKVFVHGREDDGRVQHCLLLQHGSKRKVIDEDRPFGLQDVPEIVRFAKEWARSASISTTPKWADIPDDE